MDSPMFVLRKIFERAFPGAEFNEDEWQRAVDYCEQPVPPTDDPPEPR